MVTLQGLQAEFGDIRIVVALRHFDERRTNQAAEIDFRASHL
jgi:hypothetical protein